MLVRWHTACAGYQWHKHLLSCLSNWLWLHSRTYYVWPCAHVWVCMCVWVHIWTGKLVSHWNLESLTGDFVYLISSTSRPLPTWTSDQVSQKEENLPLLLIPNNIPRIVAKTQKKRKEEERTDLSSLWPAPMALTTSRFYPHSTKKGNTSQCRAHMGSITIPWKVKVGNKENIPLIWGLPQAGCEGNLGGPLF